MTLALRVRVHIAAAGLLPLVACTGGRSLSAHADASQVGDSADATPDASTTCPANSPRITHSCGLGAAGTSCYYPAFGESPQSLNSSCDDFTWVCCADPGPATSAASYCATDTSREDQAEVTFTKRDDSECLTAVMFQTAAASSFFSTPPGYGMVTGYRGACDASPSVQVQYAIGALGSVADSAAADGGAVRRFDVHLVFFFDNGSGTPDTARADVDGLATGSCVGGPDAGAGLDSATTGG
jgi:hypothetical protein